MRAMWDGAAAPLSSRRRWAGNIAALYHRQQLRPSAKTRPRLSPNKTWEGPCASCRLCSRSRGVSLSGDFATKTSQSSTSRASLADHSSSPPSSTSRPAWRSPRICHQGGAGVKGLRHPSPGHGGILDRIDCSLVAAPVLWYCPAHQGLLRLGPVLAQD